MIATPAAVQAGTGRPRGRKPPKDVRQSVAAALARLQLASEVRELAGLAKPVRIPEHAGIEHRLRALASAIQSRLARDTGSWYSEAVLRLSVAWLRFLSGTWKAPAYPLNDIVRVRRERRDEFTHAANGFVSSSSDETMLVRVTLLLRLMRRHREAAEFLVRRWESDLSHSRAAYWLSRFLEESGERKAAALLSGEGEEPLSGGAPRGVVARRRHVVVMLAMFDSDVFRASLGSLLRSDFSGDVVVVEDGLTPEATCREFCERSGVRYLNSPTWSGSAAAMNLGLRALSPATEVVIFTHNDVLWPKEWFRQYDETWDRVLPGGRVGLLNLGYLQFKRRLDSSLVDLFLHGLYEDLVWVLRAVRDTPHLMDQVQQCEVRNGEQPFGLSRDPWNDWTPDLRQMTGRFSVAASFPYALWKEIGGFSEDLPYGFDVELQRAALHRRQWILFLGNPPLVHLTSSDTRSLAPAEQQEFTKKVQQTYDAFERKYGWHIEHFLNLYFSETTVVHQDQILRAVNDFSFDEIDFVFDDFAARLSGTKLANCELTWCRHRDRCAYI